MKFPLWKFLKGDQKMITVMKRRRRVEEFWSILAEAFIKGAIGLCLIVFLVIFIVNKNIEKQEKEYGITMSSTTVMTEHLSVKEQAKRYMDTLPIPARIESLKPRMSIYKEEILLAKERQTEMEKFLKEAIARNPQIGTKVIGMTPSICMMNTSAYCACIKCCGKEDGQTASESQVIQWYTVAVGEMYEFGTIIYIPGLRDKPNGGWFVVQDRGGAISSEKLDIYFSSHEAALQYGRKNQECYIFKF